MIIIKNNTITCNQGDSFLTYFRIVEGGYKLEGTETVKFTVKGVKNELVISATCALDTVNNIIAVDVSRAKMATLPAGTYRYDLVMTRPDNSHITLIGPCRFEVKEVVHND